MDNLFSINICRKNLNINNKSILKHILNLKKNTKGRKISNITGWQSLNFNLKENIFSELNKQISVSFIEYIDQIPLKNSFKISAMWTNINSYKDYNLVHGHGDSVISGAYYLKVPKNSGKLFFMNPALEGIEYTWGKCIEKFTEQNSSYSAVDVTENDLILFPSWLRHGVEPNLNKKEGRISISFNISIV
tara:strand:+ start:629 stop:1198 length:570 start_codon:yes stop_codon:yes gene_type:complete